MPSSTHLSLGSGEGLWVPPNPPHPGHPPPARQGRRWPERQGSLASTPSGSAPGRPGQSPLTSPTASHQAVAPKWSWERWAHAGGAHAHCPACPERFTEPGPVGKELSFPRGSESCESKATSPRQGARPRPPAPEGATPTLGLCIGPEHQAQPASVVEGGSLGPGHSICPLIMPTGCPGSL